MELCITEPEKHFISFFFCVAGISYLHIFELHSFLQKEMISVPRRLGEWPENSPMFPIISSKIVICFNGALLLQLKIFIAHFKWWTLVAENYIAEINYQKSQSSGNTKSVQAASAFSLAMKMVDDLWAYTKMQTLVLRYMHARASQMRINFFSKSTNTVKFMSGHIDEILLLISYPSKGHSKWNNSI